MISMRKWSKFIMSHKNVVRLEVWIGFLNIETY